MIMQTSTEYVEKINEILSTTENADIYILNDKLTLSVFSVLEKNLKNVRRIYLIIRDSKHLPAGQEMSREFEMNVNDTFSTNMTLLRRTSLRTLQRQRQCTTSSRRTLKFAA